MKSLHAIRAWVEYRMKARYWGGHRVHSPYLFHFLNTVLFEDKPYYAYGRLRSHCRRLSKSAERLEVSRGGLRRTLRVSSLFRMDESRLQFNELLHRICVHASAHTLVEVFGAAGLAAAYMASADSRSHLYMIEPDAALSAFAGRLHRDLGLDNISVIGGEPLSLLEQTLSGIGRVDIFHIVLPAGISGEDALRIYSLCRAAAHERTIMVLDGIHSSVQTGRAWRHILDDSAHSLAVDILHRGIVWFSPELPRRCFTVAY